MKFSQTELKVLKQISQGNDTIKGIASAIDKGEKQVYRASRKLVKNGFLEFSKGNLQPKKVSHVVLLLQVLSEYPNLIQLLSGSGIKILIALLEPKTVENVISETGLKKSVVYKKLKQAMSVSVVKRKGKQYFINKKIWEKLKEFLVEIKIMLETTDSRVPTGSTIYYKTDKEIVFSSRSKLDAVLTAFSAYEKHGIKILLTLNYYYLPKKRLSKKEVFIHSLYVTEKEKTIRHLIYVALFYIKFKKYLSSIKHPILEKIKIILKGKKLYGYPELKEIKEKAEIYDIEF